MSGVELGSNEAWKESFFEHQERTTPARDYQPGWKLTALGVTIGVMALLMLSI